MVIAPLPGLFQFDYETKGMCAILCAPEVSPCCLDEQGTYGWQLSLNWVLSAFISQIHLPA